MVGWFADLVLTRIEQPLRPLILLFRFPFVLHGFVRFDEGQPLTTVGQILGVHPGKVDRQIEQRVGNHLADDAGGVLRAEGGRDLGYKVLSPPIGCSSG